MKKRAAKSDKLDDLQFGIRDLFEVLSDAIAEVSTRIEEGETGEIRRNFDFQTKKGPIKAEAGIRMRMAGLETSAPSVRPTPSSARTPKNAAKTSDKTTYQELVYSVFEDDSGWHLTADMPGVSKEQLMLNASGGELDLRTNGQRLYAASVPLPEGASLANIACTLQNGILELSYSAAESDP